MVAPNRLALAAAALMVLGALAPLAAAQQPHPPAHPQQPPSCGPHAPPAGQPCHPPCPPRGGNGTAGNQTRHCPPPPCPNGSCPPPPCAGPRPTGNATGNATRPPRPCGDPCDGPRPAGNGTPPAHPCHPPCPPRHGPGPHHPPGNGTAPRPPPNGTAHPRPPANGTAPRPHDCGVPPCHAAGGLHAREGVRARADTPAGDARVREGAGVHAAAPCPAPCRGPGHGLEAREAAHARVRAGNATVGAGEHARVRGHAAPPPAPCPPKPCGPPHAGGAAVAEEAHVRVRAGNATVGADERARGGLRLGQGCRDGPADPRDPASRAGRRAHALQEAIAHLEGRLARLQGTVDGTLDRLMDGNLTDAAEARLERRLGQLERLQDHLLGRLAHLGDELQRLYGRWGEPIVEAVGETAGDA